MEQEEYDKMAIWLEENAKLFPPTNSQPNQTQRTEMFYWANKLDTTQTHKSSSCGRCYYNARTAIMKALTIF